MTIGADHEIAVSFVHGFHDHVPCTGRGDRPALWTLGPAGEETHAYPFPLEPHEFEHLSCPVSGEPPRRGASPAAGRPRFGFTGLIRVGDSLLAGTWNGICVLDTASKRLTRFLSNRFTCYLHRFHADETQIIFAMPFMDLVVVMDHQGVVLDRFTIDRSLKVSRRLPDPDVDWRFVSKPWSGPTGLFHFNSVQRIGDEIVLMSRNLGAFVVVRDGADRAALRTLNYKTPTCVHDGDFVDGRYHLTSIDGKVLIASAPDDHDPALFRYDLQVECVRLAGTERNWCRGIAVTDDNLYTTVDGRYDTELSFGLVQLDRAGNILDQRRFRWANVGDERDIRYVTGFDVAASPIPASTLSSSSQAATSSLSSSR